MLHNLYICTVFYTEQLSESSAIATWRRRRQTRRIPRLMGFGIGKVMVRQPFLRRRRGNCLPGVGRGQCIAAIGVTKTTAGDRAVVATDLSVSTSPEEPPREPILVFRERLAGRDRRE